MAASKKAKKNQRNRASEAFVVIAMTMVTIAFGVGLYLQFGLTFWLALVAALSVFVAMLSMHVLLRRAERIDALSAEIQRLELEVQRLGGSTVDARSQQAAPPASRPPYAAAPGDVRALGPAGVSAAAPPAQRAAPVAMPAAGNPAAASAAGVPAPSPFPPPLPAGAPAGAPEAFDQDTPDARMQGRSLRDLWSFRPASPPALPPVSAAAADIGPPPPQGWPLDGLTVPAAASPPPIPASAPPREADVEMIQGLIKKLADQVNAADTRAQPPRPGEPTDADRAIEDSLNALRATADTMRGEGLSQRAMFDARPPGTPYQAATHLPPPIPPQRNEERGPPQLDLPPPLNPAMSHPAARRPHRLDAVARALDGGHYDVLLEPILGLADRRTQHFEVSLRLRGEDGQPLDLDGAMPDLAGSGLLPLLDCARVKKSSQVARRLADRGKPGSVFSTFSGEALGHDRFLNDFTDAYAESNALARQLVLSFEQQDARMFAPGDWDMLAEMREMGFRFAIESVGDLDMDFEALRMAGFEFVKLDADVFLNGMPASGGMVPAADICRHLAGLGMTLIVDNITDENEMARIFGFGVALGQGSLFGGARPVKAEALAEKPSSVAA